MTLNAPAAKPFALNPKLAVGIAAKAFARSGVVVIKDALAPGDAETLAAAMGTEPGFNLVTRLEGRHRDFDADAMAGLPPARRLRFDRMVAEGAQAGFQYLYETWPLYDAGREGRPIPAAFARALALVESEAFLQLARKVCWNPRIGFADAQLTRFRPGHFLTTHDDEAPGKGRVAAYVLQLCADWRADHGGVLNFFSPDGEVRRGLTPGFNRLVLFSVPRPHAVSVVAPFAPAPRLAMTGWLREGPRE